MEKSYFYVWLTLEYFGLKLIIHCHVQLYTDAFLRRKAVEKPFAAQTPPRKRGYVEDFALNLSFLASIIPTNVTALLLRYVHVTYGKIAARQARGYGVLCETKLFRHKYYSLYWHAVNRTKFSDQLAYGKMTLLNFSFMFGWCEVNIQFCFAGTK